MDKMHITQDLERIHQELSRLDQAVAAFRMDPKGFSPVMDPEYIILNTISTVLQSIYTNIESVLVSILKSTDNYRPEGDSYHKDLLARSEVGIVDVREPIITQELRKLLSHLLGFMHLARKRYAVQLDLKLSLENFDRAGIAIPMFSAQIKAFLEAWLGDDADGNSGASGGPSRKIKP
jgi:hypothetical protein